jgi:hypothetical protein
VGARQVPKGGVDDVEFLLIPAEKVWLLPRACRSQPGRAALIVIFFLPFMHADLHVSLSVAQQQVCVPLSGIAGMCRSCKSLSWALLMRVVAAAFLAVINYHPCPRSQFRTEGIRRTA